MDGVPLIPGDGPLAGDTQADVCVVGAGVAGLTTAYLLAREGRSVVVLDDGAPGMGETLRTTAHLTAAIDDRIFVLERKFGGRKARLAVESQLAAIDRIERVCLDEHLDGVFRRVDGHLFLQPGEPRDLLGRELEAARRCGLPDVRMSETTPLPFEAGPCLVFPRQAEVDAGEYLAGLADAIRRMGGRIHGGTHADEVEEGSPNVVVTANGRVECESVVVCTNSPVFGKVALHTKQEQYRTYVCGYEVPRGSIPRGLYWDTFTKDAGYHYIRLADRSEPGNELLLVGGEDHRTGEGDPVERFRRLHDWAAIRFGVGAPTYQWSGQVIEPADHLPFLGRFPGMGKTVYVITGDSGQGFTNHTCGAMLVTDLIQGRRNPWQGLYSPSRQGITGLLSRLRGNAEGAAELAKGKLGVGEAGGEQEIRPGSGAVVTRDGVKVACYREPSGELRECAAECTHMGAIVQWNDAEKTWDCPWHGSRFSALGQVINGPANKALDAAPSEARKAKESGHGRPRRGRRGKPTRQRTPAGEAAGDDRRAPRTPR
jgi:glycine/D-amino acid oxidase-like deaminating enzyme/nitrite reductase/ring-hydroxylating ferredoxin subunit